MIGFILENLEIITAVTGICSFAFCFICTEVSRFRDADILGIEKRMIEFRLRDVFGQFVLCLSPLLFAIALPLFFAVQFSASGALWAFIVSFLILAIMIFPGLSVLLLEFTKAAKMKGWGIVIIAIMSLISALFYFVLFISTIEWMRLTAFIATVLLIFLYGGLTIHISFKALTDGYLKKKMYPLNTEGFSIAKDASGKEFLIGARHNSEKWILVQYSLNEADKTIEIVKGKIIVSDLNGYHVEILNGFKLKLE